jgi:hypothetical protein
MTYFTTIDTTYKHSEDVISVSEYPFDKVKPMFEVIFSDANMKEKNKKLILFLQSNIVDKDWKTLFKFFNDTAVKDFHVSLIKSSLIMIENTEELNEVTESLNELFFSKLPHLR